MSHGLCFLTLYDSMIRVRRHALLQIGMKADHDFAQGSEELNGAFLEEVSSYDYAESS